MAKPNEILTRDQMRDKIRSELTEELKNQKPIKDHSPKYQRDVIWVYHPECPEASGVNGRVPEHRYVWWFNHKNDPIKHFEIIHHINGNYKDNRIENLEKVSFKEHMKRHRELNRIRKLNTGSSKQ